LSAYDPLLPVVRWISRRLRISLNGQLRMLTRAAPSRLLQDDAHRTLPGCRRLSIVGAALAG
jgi:hypothetical protein